MTEFKPDSHILLFVLLLIAHYFCSLSEQAFYPFCMAFTTLFSNVINNMLCKSLYMEKIALGKTSWFEIALKTGPELFFYLFIRILFFD